MSRRPNRVLIREVTQHSLTVSKIEEFGNEDTGVEVSIVVFWFLFVCFCFFLVFVFCFFLSLLLVFDYNCSKISCYTISDCPKGIAI